MENTHRSGSVRFLRGDADSVTIGDETNIQDLTACHADPGKPLIIGNRITVGHGCILHGCIIEDLCLIGMRSVIMNEARIGKGSIVGAGAVVLENTVIPPFSLVIGSPAVVKKTYQPEILIKIEASAKVYTDRAQTYLFKSGKITRVTSLENRPNIKLENSHKFCNKLETEK